MPFLERAKIPIISTKRCETCKGVGLIKSASNEIRCKKCVKDCLLQCFKCEWKKDKGIYTECSECLGTGENHYDKDNKLIIRSNFL